MKYVPNKNIVAIIWGYASFLVQKDEMNAKLNQQGLILP